MAKFFGTDGVRGVANKELTPELAFDLGRAAAQVLALNSDSVQPRIIIGKDTRISGDMLEAALAAGICAAGVSVTLLGVIPTPGVAILCRQLNADAGAVISASHNHFADNGIKFFSGTGYKLPDHVEAAIESLLNNRSAIERAEGEKLGKIEWYNQAVDDYKQFLLSKFDNDLSGLKVAVDCANGAASNIAATVFSACGAEVVAIGNKPNGCNINNGYGSTHPQALQDFVKDQMADLGLAFDGDADRLIAVDSDGVIIDGDMIIAICAAEMAKKGQLNGNRIVATRMSNIGLNKAMAKLGIVVEETDIGDRYVLERMMETGANLGGEQSGHIILSDYNSTGDGMIAALYLLNVIKSSGKSLGELAQIIEKRPQVLVNVKLKDKNSWRNDKRVSELIANAERELAAEGRLLIRPSGTEPVVRLMAQGPDEQRLEQLIEKIAAAMNAVN